MTGNEVLAKSAQRSPTQMDQTDTSKSSIWERYFWLGIIAVLGIAAVVRFLALGSQDFWLDELHSMINSAGLRDEFAHLPTDQFLPTPPRYTELQLDSTARAVWSTMRADSHPPLYFLLLLWWRRMVGDGEGAVRTLAVVFSVLSIIPPAAALRAMGRPRAGLLAAAMLALAFAHISMAQQNRPYSLAILLTSTGFWMLVRMETSERRGASDPNARTPHATSLLVYGLCTYLALLTHYFTALAMLAQGVYGLLRLRGRALHGWIAVSLFSLLAAGATWGPSLAVQIPFILSQDWLVEKVPDHTALSLARWADLPVRLLLPRSIYTNTRMVFVAGSVLLATCLFFVLRRKERATVMFLLWYAVPVCALVLWDITRGNGLLKYHRYAAIAVPGLVGLLAIVVDGFRPPVRWLLFGGMVILAVYKMEFPAALNSQGRVVASILRYRASPDDLVVYSAEGYPWHWLEYLFTPISYYWPDTPCRTLLLRSNPAPEVAAKIREYPRIFVICTRLVRPRGVISDDYEETYQSNFIFQLGKIYEFTRRVEMQVEPQDPVKIDHAPAMQLRNRL